MKFIESLLQSAHKNGQTVLTEAQCYEVFNHLGLKTPLTKKVLNNADISALLPLFEGNKIVIKILSSKTLHKTDKGGVRICDKTDAPAVFKQMSQTFQIDTFMLCEFIDYPHFALGQEILLGARYDKAFGPVITLGIGGTDAENITKQFKPGICPSVTMAAEGNFEDFIAKSFIWQYTGGNVRGGKKHADIKELTAFTEQLAKTMLYFSGESEFIIEELEINPLAAANGKLVALDGVIRFKQANKKPVKNQPTETGILSLLEPKTIAVVGVSSDKVNMGRIILRNIIEAGFHKNNIFIIKDNCSEIDGVKCFPTCKDLPQKAETLVITIPAPTVPRVLEEAALSGKVNGIVLISGGIGEKEGSDNIRQQVDDIIALGKKINPDFTLNGSNSLGMVSNPVKMNTLFIPKDKLTPPLGENIMLAPCAFISQSGAFVISALGKMEHIKPVYCVMTGNQLDITVTDYAAYIAGLYKIKVLLLYIEGLKEHEGVLLKNAVEKATAGGKNIVIYMAGRTPTGQKAVMGHTASIAGDYFTARQILTKAGAFMADTFEEFEAFSQMTCAYTGNMPKNNNVFMISNAGFETSGMADNILSGGPLKSPLPQNELSQKLKDILAKYKLDKIVDIRNPFDVTPMCPDEAALEIVQAVCKSGQYGSIIFSTIPLSPVIKTLKDEKPYLMPKLAYTSKKYGIPVIISVSSGERFSYFRNTALEAGLCVFLSADNAVRSLSVMVAASGQVKEF